VLLLTLAVILGCKIDLKVRSLTKQSFEFETLVPALNKHTERLLIETQYLEKKTLVSFIITFKINYVIRLKEKIARLNLGFYELIEKKKMAKLKRHTK
jgi:hypothetical protein